MASPVPTNPRKQPKQERSRRMYRTILDASIRILHEEGALGFTTTKVAAAAGVSVGSLYQYFPNKQALIAALHDDDIDQGWETALQIVDHPTWTPRRKLTEFTRWFFETEAQEAATLGAAFGDLDVFIRDQGARSRDDGMADRVAGIAADFLSAGSPRSRTAQQLDHDGNFLFSTIESLAKSLATRELTQAQRQRWADDTAMMLASHLDIID